MKKYRKKVDIKNCIVFSMSIICFLVFIYSFVNIVIWILNNKKNNEIKETINTSVKEIIDEETKKTTYEVDFVTLKEQNPDTVAYLKINNTNVKYIVVKGNDNDYYLTHNFNKEYNKSGWIFADYKNNFDGRDKNIIIYGHNTKDGSMFGSLHNTLKKEWYTNKANLIIPLVSENETTYYEIFSIYVIKAEDYYITTDFSSNEEFINFVKNIKARSYFKFDTDISDTESILTLSTCTNAGVDRVVIHARKIENVD